MLNRQQAWVREMKKRKPRRSRDRQFCQLLYWGLLCHRFLWLYSVSLKKESTLLLVSEPLCWPAAEPALTELPWLMFHFNRYNWDTHTHKIQDVKYIVLEYLACFILYSSNFQLVGEANKDSGWFWGCLYAVSWPQVLQQSTQDLLLADQDIQILL